MPTKEQLVEHRADMHSLAEGIKFNTRLCLQDMCLETKSDAELLASRLAGRINYALLYIYRQSLSHLDILQWIGFEISNTIHEGYIIVHHERDIRAHTPPVTSGIYIIKIQIPFHKLRSNTEWMVGEIRKLIIESELQDHETNHQRQHG